MNNNKGPDLIGSSGDSLREAFGKTISSLANKYPNFVVFDADVAGGTGTHHFQKSNPNRFYQFGIAEQNMMAAAGGFASTGLIPLVTTFAVFCLRAIEQVRLSIAYSNRNVKIIASHPGLDVGPDGASAQALEDLAILRSIPGMTVISPCDPNEIAEATEEILKFNGPVYMRTGRSPAHKVSRNTEFKIGKGQTLIDGSDVTIIACGIEVSRSLEAAKILKKENISVRVVNMSTIKPIDKELLIKCSMETNCIVTAEDHSIIGGLGSAVSEVITQYAPCVVEFVAVKDCFGESGEPEELATKYEISTPFIVKAAIKAYKRKKEFVTKK